MKKLTIASLLVIALLGSITARPVTASPGSEKALAVTCDRDCFQGRVVTSKR